MTWTDSRNKWVTSQISLAQLAFAHGIAYVMLCFRSAFLQILVVRERWIGIKDHLVVVIVLSGFNENLVGIVWRLWRLILSYLFEFQ